MKPFRNLAETRTADGSRFSLHEHDGQYFLKLNGRQLMGSNATVSELLLADLACAWQPHRQKPRVLIGGLGLGFSLRRALELNASALILVHNHPSGDPTPSQADIAMTREIADISKPLGILLHDHIFVGRNGHASLKGMGLI